MGTVTIKEMLDEMETGNPFSVSFVSLDVQRKKGGEIKEYKECVLLQKNDVEKSNSKPEKKANYNHKTSNSRNPNHYKNFTRAFQVCINGNPTSTIKKLHVFLVLNFNNKKLIL